MIATVGYTLPAAKRRKAMYEKHQAITGTEVTEGATVGCTLTSVIVSHLNGV